MVEDPNIRAKLQVRSVWQKDRTTLSLEWSDGKSQEFDVVELRRKCPCASCVDETSGVRVLDPGSVADTVRPEQVRSVGRYAIGVEFSDGHKTGIYSYDYLRNHF